MVLVLVTAGFTGSQIAQAQDTPKPDNKLPNLVVVFTDDQGYNDVGCFGAKGIQTPNLDRMASEGMRFTDFCVTHGSCSPSRASLMTGCYPPRVGIPGVLGPRSKHGLNTEELTLAEVAKQKGYATAAIGKWHIGDRPKFLPTRHGFDEFFGLPYSNDMWPLNPRALSRGRHHPPLPLMDGEKVVATNPDQRMLTTWYTERAVKFIEKNKDRPFFVYLAHSMPHVPLHVSNKYSGKSERGLYGDVIMEIDWSVGQVLDTLKRLDLDERTLVIFTSDNGPWLCYGDHAGLATPLREGKGTTFEGGMREPCIMRWPGKIPAGKTCDEFASTLDILPTFAKLIGVDLPKDRIIDGVDMWPLMADEPGARTPHEAFYYYSGYELQAIRDGRWKLHFPHKYQSVQGLPGRGSDYAPYKKIEIGLSLFDLKNDIGETTNVADQHPEIVKRLSACAEKARNDLGDSRMNRPGKNRREPGRWTQP